MIKKIIIIGVLFISLLPLFSFAATSTNGGDVPVSGSKGATGGLIVCRGVDCTTWAQLIASIENLIKFTFKLAVVAATISIAYAGFLYLTGGSNPGQVSKAHGIFWMVVKGFIIMLTAYLLVKLILDTLVSNKAFNLLE